MRIFFNAYTCMLGRGNQKKPERKNNEKEKTIFRKEKKRKRDYKRKTRKIK